MSESKLDYHVLIKSQRRPIQILEW